MNARTPVTGLLARTLSLIVAGCGAVAFAQAQTPGVARYPAKPVRIIVGFAPGGGTDIVGRIVAQKLSEATGQSFYVENRPGASATIATALVAKEKTVIQTPSIRWDDCGSIKAIAAVISFF